MGAAKVFRETVIASVRSGIKEESIDAAIWRIGRRILGFLLAVPIVVCGLQLLGSHGVFSIGRALPVSAVSGNINSEPMRKPAAPSRVNSTASPAASKPGAWGGTKANTAEIMKAMQPSRLAKVTHQERLCGRQAKCA